MKEEWISDTILLIRDIYQNRIHLTRYPVIRSEVSLDQYIQDRRRYFCKDWHDNYICKASFH